MSRLPGKAVTFTEPLISPLRNGKISIQPTALASGDRRRSHNDIETVLEVLDRFQYFQLVPEHGKAENRPHCCCCLPFSKACNCATTEGASYTIQGSAINTSMLSLQQKESQLQILQLACVRDQRSSRCSTSIGIFVVSVCTSDSDSDDRKDELFSIQIANESQDMCCCSCWSFSPLDAGAKVEIFLDRDSHPLASFSITPPRSVSSDKFTFCVRNSIKCWNGERINVERNRSMFKGYDYIFMQSANGQEKTIAEMQSKPQLCSIQISKDINSNSWKKAVLLGYMLAVNVEGFIL